jgi:glycogen synthase kinase 3 beta
MDLVGLSKLRIESRNNVSPSSADFQKVKFLGKGAFGSVYLVKELATGKQLVMKETYQNPKFANREAELCELVNHPNIVKFHCIWCEKHGPDKYLHLVMDAYPMNLQNFLDKHIHKEKCIPEYRIRKFMLQMLKGLQHLHMKGIAHRDLKPDNVLVRPDMDKIAICDLGSAKFVQDGSYNKSYICSRLYRAPELILGCQDYTTKIDIWSLGCILGELYLLRPLFPGKDNTQQLEYIQRLLGVLSREERQRLKTGGNGFLVKVKFPTYESALHMHAQTPISKLGVSLIKSMLQYDHTLRPTCDAVARSAFFYSRSGHI